MKDYEKIDRENLQIFFEHWNKYVEQYPSHKQVYFVIEKMLVCGNPASSYVEL